MIVRLVAGAFVGLSVLLIVWAVYRTRGKRMPKALWPILFAASLLGYGVYDEYSWERRTRAALPDDAVVLEAIEGRPILSPWARLVPRVDSLVIVDPRSARRHPAHPGLVLAELVQLERMHATVQLNIAVDCEDARRAALPAEPRFAADGRPVDVSWVPLQADDALLGALCV